MFYLLIIAGIFLADFIIKRTVEKKLALGEKKTYAKGKIVIQKYYNKGFALDRFEKYPKFVAYGSGVVCSLMVVKFCRLLFQNGQKGIKAALAMIIGGAASNIYDRFHKKYVVDYICFNIPWKPLRKIIFNISDFFIIFGAVLLFMFQKIED